MASESTPVPQTRSCTTVLLIDDDESQRKHWSDSLKSYSGHYSVFEASSAEAGVEICRTGKVDCVRLDLDMPISGFSALWELIPDRPRPAIAVIIFTHLVHANLSGMAQHNGAQDWLVKQRTSVEQLHRAIQNAVATVRSKQNKL